MRELLVSSQSLEDGKSESNSLSRSCFALGNQGIALVDVVETAALNRHHFDEIVFFESVQSELLDVGNVRKFCVEAA